jgi:hypothetical protein
MSQLRTNAILDAAGGNTATINTVPLRPGVLDPENRIINGAFDFWQRGTSFTADAYGADRWKNAAGGGTVTMSRQSFTVGDTLGNNNPTYFLRQTVSGQTLASQLAVIEHRIEGVRSYAGQTITVLGWARRSSGSGNITVRAEQNFGTGGSPSATVSALSNVSVTLTTSWEPFAATFAIPSIAGKTLGSNGNDFFRLMFWTSAGSDFNSAGISLGLQTIGVDLWGVHIKVGTHTTAATDLYKQPELGPELQSCYRYFQQTVITNGTAVNTVVVNGIAPLVVTMRAPPAVSLTGNTILTDGFATNPTQSSPNVSLNNNVSSEIVYVRLENFSGLTAGRVYFSGLSGSPIRCDAEL